MAKVEVRVSDLSGELIRDESDLTEITVIHPDFEEPIRLDALVSDIQGKLPEQQDYIALTVDGERYLMSISEFNNLFAEDAQATLERAFQEQQPRRRRRQTTQRRPKVNYATPEHAGEPHRGRITEEEKQIVRDNLASVNERLIRDGHRPITPDDPEMVERYGLTPSEPAADEE